MPRDKPRHYASFEGFKKNMAYIHIHKVPHHQHKEVYVAGKKYRPSHKHE